MYRSGPGTLRDQFLDQFEIDGSDWLYRYRETGAAYRVTDQEKHRLVAAFDRRQRWTFWALLPIALAILFLLIWVTADPAPGSFAASIKPWVTGSGVLVVGALRVPMDHYAFRIPLRALARRQPVAPAWSREERQRLALERLPLAAVVGAATISFLILLYFALERPPIGPIGIALIVASIAALAWATVQGYRKWQVARADVDVMSPTT